MSNRRNGHFKKRHYSPKYNTVSTFNENCRTVHNNIFYFMNGEIITTIVFKLFKISKLEQVQVNQTCIKSMRDRRTDTSLNYQGIKWITILIKLGKREQCFSSSKVGWFIFKLP